MTEAEFLEEMQDVLDREDELSLDADLSGIEEWDSLAFVSFLAAMSTKCTAAILPNKVREAKTLRDLFLLVQE